MKQLVLKQHQAADPLTFQLSTDWSRHNLDNAISKWITTSSEIHFLHQVCWEIHIQQVNDLHMAS